MRIIADYVNSSGAYNPQVIDVTNNGLNPIFMKQPATGKGRFVAVQTELFMGDGTSALKTIAAAKVWKKNTQYNIGDIITDSNGNLQVFEFFAMNGAVSSSVVESLTLKDGTTQKFLILTFTENIPTLFPGSLVNLGLQVYANHIIPSIVYEIPNVTEQATGTLVGSGGDGSFTPGGQYGVQIVAVNSNGTTLPGPFSALVTVPSSSDSIHWTWTAIAGAASYQLWDGSQYWTVSGTSFTQVGIHGTTGTLPTRNTTGIVSQPGPRVWEPVNNIWGIGPAPNQLILKANDLVAAGPYNYSPADAYTSFQVNDLSAGNLAIALATYGYVPQTGPTQPTWQNLTSDTTPPYNANWGYDYKNSVGSVFTIDGPTVAGGNYGFGQIIWTALMNPYLQSMNWGVTAPGVTAANPSSAAAAAPTCSPGPSIKYWMPRMTQPYNTGGSLPGGFLAIMDPNGNIQASFLGGASGSGTNIGGYTQPTWSTKVAGITIDGGLVWVNYGVPGAWYAATQVGSILGSPQYSCCIIDSNSNLQLQVNAVTGTLTTGSTAPAFATTIGGNVTEDSGLINWLCMGQGFHVGVGAYQYAYSYHSVDGTVSTPSAVTILPTNIIGPQSGFEIDLSGPGSPDSQVDEIWLWRTAGGQSTLILLDIIPNPGNGYLATAGAPSVIVGTAYKQYNSAGTWSYTDIQPDTALNAEIPAPVALAGNPPPVGITAPVYHLQRIWAIVNNTVVYSAGPDAVTGNGNTQFSPLNYIAYPEQPIRLIPFTTNNGGILVLTTSNIYVILGTGTTANPFYTTIYMPNVGILNYDAVDIIGSTLYLMTSKSKLASIDPSAGYVEIGFPIGDQFTNCNQGGAYLSSVYMGAIYNPATAHITWHEQGSGDTAIYFSDGEFGWFRYSPVATPESGYVWSPRAVILGGCAFAQSVETSPGVSTLLIAPYGGGPILKRDPTVTTDWISNAVGSTKTFSYPSYLTIGNIVLCQSGEIAEVAHIALKSMAVGAKPTVSLLFGELASTPAAPFAELEWTANDPPDLPPSQTIYSDRYTAMQNGVCPLCDNLQLRIDYGIQGVADELLVHSIYGAHHAERKQQ